MQLRSIESISPSIDRENTEPTKEKKHDKFTQIENVFFVAYRYLTPAENTLYPRMKMRFSNMTKYYTASLQQMSCWFRQSEETIRIGIRHLTMVGLIQSQKVEKEGKEVYSICIVDLRLLNNIYFDLPIDNRPDYSEVLLKEKRERCAKRKQKAEEKKVRDTQEIGLKFSTTQDADSGINFSTTPPKIYANTVPEFSTTLYQNLVQPDLNFSTTTGCEQASEEAGDTSLRYSFKDVFKDNLKDVSSKIAEPDQKVEENTQQPDHIQKKSSLSQEKNPTEDQGQEKRTERKEDARWQMIAQQVASYLSIPTSPDLIRIAQQYSEKNIDVIHAAQEYKTYLSSDRNVKGYSANVRGLEMQLKLDTTKSSEPPRTKQNYVPYQYQSIYTGPSAKQPSTMSEQDAQALAQAINKTAEQLNYGIQAQVVEKEDTWILHIFYEKKEHPFEVLSEQEWQDIFEIIDGDYRFYNAKQGKKKGI